MVEAYALVPTSWPLVPGLLAVGIQVIWVVVIMLTRTTVFAEPLGQMSTLEG
jgi:hypothetical protein